MRWSFSSKYCRGIDVLCVGTAFSHRDALFEGSPSICERSPPEAIAGGSGAKFISRCPCVSSCSMECLSERDCSRVFCLDRYPSCACVHCSSRYCELRCRTDNFAAKHTELRVSPRFVRSCTLRNLCLNNPSI